MSGSFADSLNHAKEGSGKRRREQENDQFSTALALSLIWSGSLGFNSMSQSGLETHTFVITFQEEGAGSVNSLGSSREAGQGSLLQQPALPSPSTARQALGCSLSRLITIYYPTDQGRDRGMWEEIWGPAWPSCHGFGQGGAQTRQHQAPLPFGSGSELSSEVLGLLLVLTSVPAVGTEAVPVWV